MLSKASEAREEEERKAAARAASNAKQAALKRVEASRLGKVLSEMTTRRVIIGLLLMLLVLPFLLPPVTDNSLSFGLRLLFNYGTSGCADFQGRQTDYSARMRGSFLGPADGLALYPCTHQEPWI